MNNRAFIGEEQYQRDLQNEELFIPCEKCEAINEGQENYLINEAIHIRYCPCGGMMLVCNRHRQSLPIHLICRARWPTQRIRARRFNPEVEMMIRNQRNLIERQMEMNQRQIQLLQRFGRQ